MNFHFWVVDLVHICHIFEGSHREATRGQPRGRKPRPIFADFWGLNLPSNFLSFSTSPPFFLRYSHALLVCCSLTHCPQVLEIAFFNLNKSPGRTPCATRPNWPENAKTAKNPNLFRSGAFKYYSKKLRFEL